VGWPEHSGIAAAAMTAAMNPHFFASRMEVVNNISSLARSISLKGDSRSLPQAGGAPK
jgi:hypothetical protein